MKKKITKSFLSVVLVLSMVFGMSIISSAATETVETGTYSWNGGTYTLYVRELSNTNVLGTMTLSHTSSQAKTTFTASKTCTSATARANYQSTGVFAMNSRDNLSSGYSVTATKSGSNITTAYGSCKVIYEKK